MKKDITPGDVIRDSANNERIEVGNVYENYVTGRALDVECKCVTVCNCKDYRIIPIKQCGKIKK